MIRRTSLPAVLPAFGRRVLVLVCAWLAVWNGPLAGQQRKGEREATPYRITGLAISAKDGSPIPHCHLTTSPAGAGGRGYGATSIQTDADEQGRFAVDVPSDGTWSVVANARGYRTQPFDEHDGFFTGVVLTQSAPSYDLVFRVQPESLIRGTLTDEAGEPVRNAQVKLFTVRPEARATDQSPLQARQSTQTDDLGQYEFAGLAPGGYEIEVQARPWYAGQVRTNSSVAPDAALDPSLDVVYPPTWYPGVDDNTSADVLTMHAGEVRQADLRLRPVASAHLLIPMPASLAEGRGGEDTSQRMAMNQPMVSQIDGDGSLRPSFSSRVLDRSNMMEIGGLAPGTYQINQPAGGGGTGHVAIVHVSASGSTTGMEGAIEEVNVMIGVDGGTQVEASDIRLRDMTTGRIFGEGGFEGPRGGAEGRGGGSGANQFGGRRPQGNQEPAGRGQEQRGRGRRRGTGEVKEAALNVRPGQYEVVVPGNRNVFLTGMVATGATAKGRLITVRDGSPHLLIHLASGLASVEGTAKMGTKLSVGAMVLLVPATLGDASSLTIVRRDQTNTDGSFHLEEVIPGQYILLAIDHGWEVNWSDAATLRSYLLHGVPLELTSSALTHPTIQAVAP